MTKTEQILLELTGRALFSAPTTINPTTVDWEALCQEAADQALTLLIWDTLTDEELAAIPKNVAEKWEHSAMLCMAKNEELLYEQEQVIQLLNNVNIPCVILKGSSSAAYYPEPTLRTMGDIDLLVKPEQQMKAVEVLQANGYGDILDESHHCHMTIHKDGIAVEVHKEPNGMFITENEAIGRKLHDFFTDAVDRREIADGLPILADEQQALVLLLHKLEHFLTEGLGLRQICDWAVFVDKRLTDKLWSSLKPILSDFGLLTFTNVITRVCIDYLNLPQGKAPWAMEADKGLAEETMEQILAEGNFGRKSNDENYGILYFTNVNASNRATSFLKVLASHCKIHWPLCGKYPILLLVAPFVAYAKYLKLRKEGKRAEIKPMSLYRKAGAKQRLYKELKPFVVE
ncbi:MAG: nucleotidyltransferase family protein [Clostridia bacterium]|nr:nucleotidyltransferase family protein [Clostridia bacterium]